MSADGVLDQVIREKFKRLDQMQKTELILLLKEIYHMYESQLLVMDNSLACVKDNMLQEKMRLLKMMEKVQ